MSTGLISEVATRKEIPAHVRFERRPVEDKAATLDTGRYVAKDVDYAIVTAPYSDGKENLHIKVANWFANMQVDVHAGRLPQAWLDQYKDAYARWQQGQELPVNGTPIKGWGVISPSQQEMLIRRHILTVEELAQINDVGIRAIGMGAIDLRNKAQGLLAQMNDKGALTIEIANFKRENDVQKGQIATLTRQVEELLKQAKRAPAVVPEMVEEIIREEIAINDVL